MGQYVGLFYFSVEATSPANPGRLNPEWRSCEDSTKVDTHVPQEGMLFLWAAEIGLHFKTYLPTVYLRA